MRMFVHVAIAALGLIGTAQAQDVCDRCEYINPNYEHTEKREFMTIDPSRSPTKSNV